MLGAMGLFLSSAIRQLENFAGVMNFVIFPMFFASSALYPLWRMRESSVLLHDICAMNPFTHAVELIRKHDCVTETRERARHYAQRACNALSIFPDSAARRAMVEAAQFAVARGY